MFFDWKKGQNCQVKVENTHKNLVNWVEKTGEYIAKNYIHSKKWICGPKGVLILFYKLINPQEKEIKRWFSSNLCFTFLCMHGQLMLEYESLYECLSTWRSLIIQPWIGQILLNITSLNLCTSKSKRPLSMR